MGQKSLDELRETVESIVNRIDQSIAEDKEFFNNISFVLTQMEFDSYKIRRNIYEMGEIYDAELCGTR